MSRQGRERKREQFIGGAGKSAPQRSRRLAVAGAAVAAVAVVALLAYTSARPTPEQSPPAGSAESAAVSASGEIRIPVSELSGGKAKFMEHAAPAGPVRFFAIKGADGVYRVALDACEICFHARKGYVQNGDEMVCRQCGNSYPPFLIDEAPGGCHPIRVPREVDGQHVVVLAADVERIHAEHASRPPMQRRMMAPRDSSAAPVPQLQ